MDPAHPELDFLKWQAKIAPTKNGSFNKALSCHHKFELYLLMLIWDQKVHVRWKGRAWNRFEHKGKIHTLLDIQKCAHITISNEHYILDSGQDTYTFINVIVFFGSWDILMI